MDALSFTPAYAPGTKRGWRIWLPFAVLGTTLWVARLSPRCELRLQGFAVRFIFQDRLAINAVRFEREGVLQEPPIIPKDTMT